MLSFEHKRAILTSFPELEETIMRNNRYNYELRFVSSGRRIVAREFTESGNGYLLGTPESKYPIDARGWMSAKNLTEDELRQSIRQAINLLQTADLRRNAKKFLETDGFLPLSSPLWRSIEILHQPPESLQGVYP